MGTSGKGHEKSLRPEEMFKLLFNSIADALFLHDLEGRFVEVNQSACDSLGYTREKLLQLPFSTIVKDGDPEALGNLWARVMQGERLTLQGFHQRRDGATFPVEVHLSPFEYEGRPHILASARDITERHWAEEALRSSESFLNSIIDQSPYPMWISDALGTLIKINQACLDLLHIKPEEVLGKYNVFHDNIVADQGVMPFLKQVFEKGEKVRFELNYDTSQLKILQLEKKTASVIIEVNVSPIVDHRGQVTNAVFQHVDITHRKRAEAALAESEQRFSTFMDHLPAAAFIKDQEGRLVFANRYLQEIFGWKDCLGKATEELLPREMSEQMIADDRRALTAGPLVIQERITDAQGAEHFFDTYKFPITAGGAPPLLGGIAVDVTDRHRVEEALKKEKLFTEAIVDSLPGTFFLLDSQGKQLRTNRSGLEISGYSWEELANIPALESIAEEDRPAGQRALAAVLERGETSIEARMLTKDGRKIPFLFTAKKFIIDNIPYILGTGTDITARKQMEEALRESQALYHDLVETAQDLIWQCDSAGRYTYLNPAWEEVFGYKIEEMLGKHFADFQPQKYAARDLQEFERLLAGNIIKGLETIHLAKDGRELHLVFNAKAVRDKDGHVSGTRGTAYNITERKLAEEALRESEERHRSLFQNNHAVMLLIDPETGAIMDANPAACAYYGYSKEELLIKTTTDLNTLPPDQVFQAMQRAETEKQKYFQFQHRLASGEVRDVEVFSGPIRIKGQDLLYSIVHDVTARKQAEQALRESEERLRLALQAANQGLYDLNIQTGEAKVSSEYATMLGYDPADFRETNARWIERLHPEDREKVAATYRAYIRGDLPDYAVEFRQRTTSGDWKWILSLGKIVAWDEDGKPLRMLGTHTDITQRKQMEESLARTQFAVDQARDAIFWVKANGGFVYVNQAACDSLGYSREELLSLSVFDIDPKFPKEQWLEHWRITHDHGSYKIETSHKTKDGRIFPVEVAISAINFGGEEFHCSFVRDISERRQAEDALRESENKYRSLYQEFRGILDAIPDGVSLISPDMKIVWTNDTHGISFLGKRPSETIGEFCYQARHGRAVPCENCKVQECFASGKPTSGESTTPEGRIFELHAVPLYGDKGEVKAVIEVARDITERKRTEEEQAKLKEQMQEVQKLESLGVLAGGIAHDFNNLLMTILGNADLALLSLSPASPARSNMEQIVRASQRAADLCGQMLAYSGRGRFVVGRYDLSEIVQEMAQILKVSVSKNAILRYNFTADLPAVEVDATQMRQVIMNLITNASEALGDQSGVISVSTGVMDCDRAYLGDSYLDDKLPEGKYVFLEIADTGAGMDEETRRRIFDPFFTTKFTGRGLGLAAVLGIVRGHKGAIKVYSEVGHGTTFKVLLPAKEWVLGDREPRATQIVHPLRSGETILLVDDDPEVRDVGTQMLGRLGFKVLTAADGQEGLKVFQECGGEIACVILDLTMPGMGGEEVFRELRRLRPDVRVILSSGYNEQEVTQRFAGKGLAGFVQKPYRMASLKEILNRVLG